MPEGKVDLAVYKRKQLTIVMSTVIKCKKYVRKIYNQPLVTHEDIGTRKIITKR